MQDRLSIMSDGLCKYTYYGKRSSQVAMSKKSIDNLSKSIQFKSLSKSSAKRIKEIITNWVIAIKLTQKQQYGKGKRFDNYLIMITLTLPSKQIESDKEIKSKYLNTFLTKLRYHFENFNYLWVSERQDNGNLHFHLICDHYFDKKLIQNLWNQSLANGEYINKFCKKFGHKNPPSTKITAQNKMKDTASYITKYVTKSEKSKPIEGKIWDCSDSLLKIKKISFNWNPLYYELISCDFYKLSMKYLNSDFRELFLFKKNFVNTFLTSELFFELEEQIRSFLSQLFPSLMPINLVKNVEITDLPIRQLQFNF